MKNLLEHWDAVATGISGKNVFLFLDYDGTLTPIVARPQDAILPTGVRDLLSYLSGLSSCRVAIVSGRSVEDVAAMVGLEKLIYAGNHGLEVRGGPGVGFKTFAPEGFRDVIRGVRDVLQDCSSRFEGVVIEDKGLSLSFHYRMSKGDDIALIKGIFKESIKRHMAGGKIRLVEGKKVFEVRPAVDWDKGRIVRWLLERDLFGDGRAVAPVYIGDDTTDEDAFRFLGGKGVTVWVGPGQKVKTDYSLKGPEQVFEFLNRVKTLKMKR